MGLLAQAVAERKSAGNVWERWVELSNFGAKSKSGPSVTKDSFFRVAAAFACIGVRSKGVAQVPFKLFRETEEGGLRRIAPARKHPVYDVVTAKPNGWQTSFEFREQMEIHVCLGNAYAFKNIYRGKLAEMFLLDPARVKPVQNDDYTITYKVTGKDGGVVEIAQDLIWHVRGPSWDGVMGMDTLQVAREALGLSIALEESHASLHSNGVRPAGVYSVDGNLSPEQHKQITGWLKKQAGAGVGEALVLDRGAKWLQQTMTGIDAQHKETRDHQIEEVCRFLGVLPIMIGHTGDKANTYASAEAMFTAHKVHTLAPEYTRIQESADINLLTDAERADGYYFKFVVNALAWASMKDMGEYFAKALGSGGSPAWHTQDEIRAFIEFDPFGGAAGKLPPLINKPAAAPAPAP